MSRVALVGRVALVQMQVVPVVILGVVVAAVAVVVVADAVPEALVVPAVETAALASSGLTQTINNGCVKTQPLLFQRTLITVYVDFRQT